ncbi:hypothetical protein GCM10010468_68720 [Actinocorallia longicatena]|uniref:Tellurite resistance protein TerB n=1 Tax=Actinocorallia longicatena TaxID=111803 RepID=A0ABP6QJB0_9ACTN
MLIFGLSVVFRTVGEGVFHCPSCGGDRRFRRRLGRRFLSFFFVPVVPLGKLGEVVECRSCRKRFATSVLRQPTAAEMEARLPAAMRAAVSLVLRAGDPADTSARVRAVDAVRRQGEEAYGPDELAGDLDMRPSYLLEEIAKAGSQLAVEAKEWFLSEVVLLALADGRLSDPERGEIQRVARALGMTYAHGIGVIAMHEGANR